MARLEHVNKSLEFPLEYQPSHQKGLQKINTVKRNDVIVCLEMSFTRQPRSRAAHAEYGYLF